MSFRKQRVYENDIHCIVDLCNSEVLGALWNATTIGLHPVSTFISTNGAIICMAGRSHNECCSQSYVKESQLNIDLMDV